MDNKFLLMVEEKNLPVTNEATAEILEEINKAYFIDEGFDVTKYEINKLAGLCEFELDALEIERLKLKRLLQILFKKVSALIMNNSLGFSSQVKHYSEVQINANDIVAIICDLRSLMAHYRQDCHTSIAIVANHRKKEYLIYFKFILGIVKTLHETEYHIKDMIEHGEFTAAIKICVETIIIAEQYIHFDCVRHIVKNITCLLGSMESYIDDALGAQTVLFELEKYIIIKSAYEKIGKIEKAAQTLQSFFRATIDSSARCIIIKNLKSFKCIGTNPDVMSYEELCQGIHDDNILPCARSIMCSLYKILYFYHCILRFHFDEDKKVLDSIILSSSKKIKANVICNSIFEFTPIVEKGVIQKSLIDNLYSIFMCAALKYNTLLCCCDLSSLKFDQFVSIVELTSRFRKFGRKHFGNHCAEISVTMEKQTKSYFNRYHMERVDELNMFLETEPFALCPVSIQFTLFDLPEFFFLKESIESFDDGNVDRFLLCHELDQELDFALISESNEFLLFLTSQVNEDCISLLQFVNKNFASLPCKSIFEQSVTVMKNEIIDPIKASSSEDSVYGLVNDLCVQKSLPNLCNTSLTLLRFFGRYIRMTSFLRSISELVINKIMQLYKYYFYWIYSFFCFDFCEIPLTELNFSTLRLRNIIDSIRRELMFGIKSQNSSNNNEFFSDKHNAKDLDNLMFIHSTNITSCVKLNQFNGIFALAQRIVGVESLIFLSKQFELLRPVLESLIKKNIHLDNFYRNILPIAIDFRKCAYGCAISRFMDFTQLIKLVINVNWNISEISSQHNSYVDLILKNSSEFKNQLLTVSNMSHVSEDLNAQIWSLFTLCIFRALVQGISEASNKCSIEGRALMLLDFELLTSGLENISSMRPLPHKNFLENYIKAFYLPQDELGEWIIHHTEYTVGQVTSLLNANSNITRKAKFSLMNILENKDLT